MRHPSHPAARSILPCSLGKLALAVHLAVLSAAVTVLPTSAHAAEQAGATQKSVNIPAGPLSRVLSAFATAHDALLSFDPALTEGKNSNGLQGSYALQQGFDVLLHGSGLEVIRQPNGSFVLRKTAVPTSSGNDAVLPTVQVTSRQDADNTYAAKTTSMGKTAQSLREIPQSVSVITRQRLDEQNINDLTTALDLTTGVTTSQTGFFASSFYSRGFAMTNMQIDGGAPMTMGLAGFQTQQDFSQYERVEILRGADALFGGAGEPGGTVNLVRKRALPHYQLLFNTSAGSWQNYRTEIDVTGPLNTAGSLRGRVVASYNDRHFFYDIVDQQKKSLYGVIEADVLPDATLSAGFNLTRMSGTPWFLGLPRYSDGSDLHLPRSTALATSWGSLQVDTDEYFLKWNQKLNPDWTFNSNLAYNTQESYRKYARAIGPINTSTNQGDVSGLITYFTPTQTVADFNLHGKFDLFGRRHEVLIGGDWQKTTGTFSNRTTASQKFDIFQFDHDAYPEPSGVLALQTAAWGQKQYGLYSNFKLQLADATRLIVGARHASYEFEQLDALGSGTRYRESGVVTPYAGVVHDIDAQWSAYASIAETYKSQATRLQGPLPGSSLGPITGKNTEIGIKGELWDGRANTAIALYRIERNGEGVRDPAYSSTDGQDGSNCCWLASGRIVSQGLDAEISGELRDGWQVFAGYTFNDNKNKGGGNARYSTVTPRHLLKLWTMYQLPAELSQWKVGGGATLQSASYQTGTISGNTYRAVQGGYAVWNARAEYAIDNHWSLALNINNLFDKVYYQTIGLANYWNWYGEPRNATLTLRGKF